MTVLVGWEARDGAIVSSTSNDKFIRECLDQLSEEDMRLCPLSKKIEFCPD
jgi:hypothetical protein